MSDQPFTLRVRDPDKWKPLLDLTARAIGIVATALGSSTMVALSVLASMTVPDANAGHAVAAKSNSASAIRSNRHRCTTDAVD